MRGGRRRKPRVRALKTTEQLGASTSNSRKRLLGGFSPANSQFSGVPPSPISCSRTSGVKSATIHSQRVRAGCPKMQIPTSQREAEASCSPSAWAEEQTCSSPSQKTAGTNPQKAAVQGGGSSDFQYPRAPCLGTSPRQRGEAARAGSKSSAAGNTAVGRGKQQDGDGSSRLIPANSSLINHGKIPFGSRERTHPPGHLKLDRRAQRAAELGWNRWPRRSLFPDFISLIPCHSHNNAPWF